MIKILTFASLYPNSCQPRHGIFVEHRLRKLVESGEVETRVVAPVPWFPFRHRAFGRYAVYASVPAKETRHGIEIDHPRYPVVPKLGMNAAPLLMARAMGPVLRRILETGYDFDLIDAHYVYPDGVAAAALGRRLGKPVVITARGDDVAVLPQFRWPRYMILNAAKRGAAFVTVSRDLKRQLSALGVAEDRIAVLRNGVDLDFFCPSGDGASAPRTADEPRTLVSVGHLLEAKGHHVAISALPDLPGCNLMIVGEGPMSQELQQQAQRLGVADRVRFVGNVLQDKLREHYAAADALVLATLREGMPNVVLEALACGTPVVATAVGGIPEIITAPEAGVLMKERTPAALAAAVQQLFAAYPRRQETRRFAERFSWNETTRGQIRLFEEVLRTAPSVQRCEAVQQRL